MFSTIFLISLGLLIGWNTTQPRWVGRLGRALADSIKDRISSD